MLPLHETLVEVHREYEKASRAAKDMVDLYIKVTTASEILNAQCITSQAENQQLSEQLRQIEEQLQKTKEELLRLASTSGSLGSDQGL